MIIKKLNIAIFKKDIDSIHKKGQQDYSWSQKLVVLSQAINVICKLYFRTTNILPSYNYILIINRCIIQL